MPLPGCSLGESPTSRRSDDWTSMAGDSCASRAAARMDTVLIVSSSDIGTLSAFACQPGPRTPGKLSRNNTPRQRQESSTQDGWRVPYRAHGSHLLRSIVSWTEHTHTHGSGHLHAVSGWQGSHPRCKPYAGQAAYACSDGQCLGSLDPHALRSDTPSDLPSDPTRAKRPKDPEVRPFFLVGNPVPPARTSSSPSPPSVFPHTPPVTPRFQEPLNFGWGLVVL